MMTMDQLRNLLVTVAEIDWSLLELGGELFHMSSSLKVPETYPLCKTFGMSAPRLC